MEDPRLRLVRSLVIIILIGAFLLTCLKIISYGYLPVDDALRHAAKVVSGRSWQDIVVLRPDMVTDRHEGWHVFLGAVHQLTGWGVERLVIFSVVFLAILFLVTPMPWLSRPEIWPFIIAIAAVSSPPAIGRVFMGRPFIVTMVVLLTICFLWPRLKSPKLPAGTLCGLVALIAVSTWFNGVPHLFFLPFLAFLLAREWLVAFRFAVVVAAGVVLGASLTGHPVLFIEEGMILSYRAFSGHLLQQMLVLEFQASSGDAPIMLGVLLVLLWRRVRGELDLGQLVRDPVFILMCLGWTLGFSVKRFWTDWGLVAALAWVAIDIDGVVRRRIPVFSNQRIAVALCGAFFLYLNLTSDLQGRWTWALTKSFLSLSDPVQREWLPDPGGIVYSDTNRVFYDTFYKNPRGPWRYLVAFEPTLMPEEDLKVWRKILFNDGAFEAFQPWVAKMKPADRLILMHDTRPNIPGLEWASPAADTWVGRLPRARPAQPATGQTNTNQPAKPQ